MTTQIKPYYQLSELECLHICRNRINSVNNPHCRARDIDNDNCTLLIQNEGGVSKWVSPEQAASLAGLQWCEEKVHIENGDTTATFIGSQTDEQLEAIAWQRMFDYRDLRESRDIIFADWPNRRSHLTWVVTASRDEIAQWVKNCRAQV